MTPDSARDEMLAVFKVLWDSLGYAVVWSDVPGAPPVTSSPWARVTVRTDDGRQSAIGSTRHTHTGTLWIQLFVPIGQGATPALTLAQRVLQVYREARGAVWYRRQRFREVGASGAFSQVNCLIDFTYDE